MKTKQEIFNELQQIAKDLNIEGTSLDILLELLSNAVSMANISIGSTVREANPLTCIDVNSAIVHASSRISSVYRGENQKFIIEVTPILSFRVNKFDELLTVSGYTLYYNDDYIFTSNRSATIEVSVGKTILTEELLPSDNIYLQTYQNIDYSETIALYSPDTKYTLVDTPQNLSENTFIPITYVDYGLRFWAKDFINKSNRYYVTGLEYLEGDNLEVSSITSIPNFNIINISQVSSRPRISNTTLIFLMSQIESKSNKILRSSRDLVYLVKDYFNGKILSFYYIVDNFTKTINVFYVLQPNQYITELDIANFNNWISSAYLIPQVFKFFLANQIYIETTLEIRYDDTHQFGSIERLLSSESSIVGRNFSIFQLLTNISKIQGVLKVDLISGQDVEIPTDSVANLSNVVIDYVA